MKAYVAMCSLSLLAGAALGHFNGQYSVATKFAEDCSRLSVVVFQDRESEAPKHFHCFELEVPGSGEIPVREEPALVPMI
ncbi:MAG: hypothetical protein R3228_13385 [Halioglobus sp.]|nr:hypothetical protein [Halioglobus sp.]